jgi:ring-1,2-phenylacetyl-CoA epoxidase subunit PaaE
MPAVPAASRSIISRRYELTAMPEAPRTARGPQAPPAARRHAVFHPLKVAAVDRLTDDAIAVTFDVPEELSGEYDFVHGQHLTVRVGLTDGSAGPLDGGAGEDVRRNYSICSPAGSGVLRIGVKRLPGGAFSEWAQDHLVPGAVLDVMTPTGRFFTHLEPSQAKHYALLAAGSGITPILSIAATVLEREPDSTVTLLYGNRTISSIMFLEELEDLKNRYPTRFALFHVLSREAGEAELLHGRIDAAKLDVFLDTLLPTDTVDEWFLCGPYEMVETARKVLTEHEVAAGRIHVELFHVEGEPVRASPTEPVTSDAGDASSVTVLLDGRSTTFDLSATAEPILEAALRVRGDAPFACKNGVCGTCRAKLLEGSVRMDRNYALEDDELADSYVLTCQSHPTTERVVLDYDA